MDAFLNIVNWPVAVVLIVVVLVWCLRDELKRVVNRTIKAGLSGFEFAPPPEQLPSPPKEGVAVTSSTVRPSGRDRLHEFIAGLRGFLAEQLEPAAQRVRSELDQTFGTNPSDQIEGLVYTVASLNVQLSHERLFYLIYGVSSG